MNKCIWSNIESDDVEEINLSTFDGETRYFILPIYKNKLLKFNESLNKKKNILLVAVILIAPLFAFSIILPEYWKIKAIAGVIIALGMIICLCPLCTPHTVNIMGIAKSIKLARIIGVVVMAIGIFVLFVQ